MHTIHAAVLLMMFLVSSILCPNSIAQTGKAQQQANVTPSPDTPSSQKSVIVQKTPIRTRIAPDNLNRLHVYTDAKLREDHARYVAFAVLNRPRLNKNGQVVHNDDFCRENEFAGGLTSDRQGIYCRTLGGQPILDDNTLSSLIGSGEGTSDDLTDWDGTDLPFDSTDTLHFVPFYEVTSGLEILSMAAKLAQSHLLFACGNTTLGQLTCHYLSENRTSSGATVIALCEVVGPVSIGPPRACIPFIVVYSDMTWISIYDAEVAPTPGGGLPGSGETPFGPPAPDLDVKIFTKRPNFPIETILAKSLAARPFSLIVEQTKSKGVAAGAPKRASEVIDPWKEWLSVVFIIQPCGADEIPKELTGYSAYCAQSFVILEISKSMNGFHPDEHGTFSAKYESAFRGNVQKVLSSECGPAVTNTGDLFVCP